MVPELLSSNLCSLRDDGPRFAFTVLWEIQPADAKIVNTEFHKSMILSKASLTYAQAQMKIDDKNLNDDLTLGLRRLNKIAKILRADRIKNGALTLASNEIRFSLDSETNDPIDVVTKELKETNSMVEEFMLLANITVAKKIYEIFPTCACLRRHPAPPPRPGPGSTGRPLRRGATPQGAQCRERVAFLIVFSELGRWLCRRSFTSGGDS